MKKSCRWECKEGTTSDSRLKFAPYCDMASMLCYNGVDSVSISARLGHAQVSTTANIYSHVIEGADQKNAEVLAEVFLKNA